MKTPLSAEELSRLSGFLAWLQRDGASPSTVITYKYKVARWLRWSAGAAPTTELVREFGRHLKRQAFRPRTRHVFHAALLQWFGWQLRTGELSAAPDVDVLDPGRLDDPRVAVAQEGDVPRLWAAARGLAQATLRERFVCYRAQAVLGLLCYSGRRRSEILALDLADVDRRSRPWFVYVRSGKGGESARIEVIPELEAVLAAWLPIRAQWCQQHGHTSDALLPVDRVRRLGEAGLTELLRDLCQRAGVGNLTAHSFRRWFGSGVAEEAGVKTAQELLGHSSPLTTERYLFTTAEKKSRALKALGAKSAPPPAPPAAVDSGHWRQVI